MRLSSILSTLFLAAMAAAATEEDTYPQQQVFAFHPDGSFNEAHFLRAQASNSRDNETDPGMSRRESQCSSSQTQCKGGCIFLGETCCPEYVNEYNENRGCDPDISICTKDGCCSKGKNCGNLGNCVAPEQSCSSGCMPTGAHCCDNDKYCLQGTHCSGDDVCKKGAAGRMGVPAMNVVLSVVALVAASTL